MEYFLRAAKYASVESDPKAMLLANILTDNFSQVNSKSNNDSNKIKILASDSYEKAAFAAYVLGKFEDAKVYQSKALNHNKTAKNYFLLAKYQVRNGESDEAVKNLEIAIDETPSFLDIISNLMDLDLASDINVLHLIKLKTDAIDKKIGDLIKKWNTIESAESVDYVKKLKDLNTKSYAIKTKTYEEFTNESFKINKKIDDMKHLINNLLSVVNNSVFCSLNSDEIEDIFQKLTKSKMLPFEEMEEVYNNFNEIVKNDKLKIGSKYAGGLVFYLDNTGQHGLVCASEDFGNCCWGIKGEIGAKEKKIGFGKENSKKILESSSSYYETVKDGWFSKKTINKEILTAARLCLESNYKGFNDWYLPTLDECKLIYKNLHKNKIGNFKKDKYWSSTEEDSVYAIAIDFSDIYSCEAFDWNKSLFSCYVRAIRSF
jgi:tetratricopeptide (TPR) repeat protein